MSLFQVCLFKRGSTVDAWSAPQKYEPPYSPILIRDEQLQEQLWEISIEAVREHLSPGILEQYGSAHGIQTDQSATSEGPSVIKSGTDGQEESS